jgi:hypothetical protein
LLRDIMPPLPASKDVRCRYCQAVLPGWLPVATRPDGAMLLRHLSQQHPEVARAVRTLAILTLLLGLAMPALASPVRCTTYEGKTLHRRHTFCDDGTRTVSTYNGQMNPRTHQVEVRCRSLMHA